ncbi:MAG: DUF3467 domain-containing protein [Planctomycetia bacterium]
MSEEQAPAGDQGPAIDDGKLQPMYTNFCRVTGTPEEIVIDFGLNTEMASTSTQPIRMSQRMVCNFYTAKRLLYALQMAVQRHEKAFGNVETNIQKRVVARPPQG